MASNKMSELPLLAALTGNERVPIVGSDGSIMQVDLFEFVKYVSSLPDATPDRLAPGGNWNGTAGSGFASVPVDPARTTAKPSARILTPPGERFTNTTTVGVIAFAKNNGSLVGGIDRVRFHLEGASVDVTEPSLRTSTRKDGSQYRAFGYWVQPTKLSATTGDAHLYAEVIPADGTMQSRVLGPYLYSFENTLHDAQVEVAPSLPEIVGARYPTLAAAINYLKAQAAKAPLITIAETAQYILADDGVDHTFANWLTIRPATGVTATLARDSYIGDAASRFSVRAGNVRFQGLVFDMRHVASVQSLIDAPFLAEDCTITNSDPEGVYSKWRGQLRPHGFVFEGASYLIDCRFEFMPNALGSGTSLARGNVVTDGAADLVGDAKCMVGNVVRNWDSSLWLLGEDAFTITYNGAEATARLSAPIAQDQTRILTATWGANSATLTVGRMEDDFNGVTGNAFWPRDVVDWVNGTGAYAGVGLADQDAGWSATLLDDTLCAFYVNIDRDDPEFSGGANGNASAMDINVKDQVRTVKCNFDIHADGYQDRFGGADENVVVYGEDWQLAGQLIFISSNTEASDYSIVNNIFAYQFTAAEYLMPTSQLGRTPKNNMHVVHNSWIDQQFRIRYDEGVTLDAYSLIAGNVMQNIVDVGSSNTAAGIILNNHLYAGGNIPGGSSGTTIGGDATTLFVDAANGDFTPAGDLMLNGITPAFGVDIAGLTRKNIEVVGAVGSGDLPAAAAPPPSVKTEWTFDDFRAETLGTGQAQIIDANTARAMRVDSSNTGALVLALQPGTYRVRCTLAEWSGNGAAQLRFRKGTIGLQEPMTVDAGAENYFAAGPVDTTFTFTEATNLLLAPTTPGRSCQLTQGSVPVVVKVA